MNEDLGTETTGPAPSYQETLNIGPASTVGVGNGKPVNLPHRCGCGVRWSGYKTAHCCACHETFSTVSNFDRHRQGPHSDVRPRFCVSPESVGLVDAGRAYRCWAMPGREREYGDE